MSKNMADGNMTDGEEEQSAVANHTLRHSNVPEESQMDTYNHYCTQCSHRYFQGQIFGREKLPPVKGAPS